MISAPSCIQPSTTLPPGLILLDNFITDEYADEIIASINWDTGLKGKDLCLCVSWALLPHGGPGVIRRF